LKKLRIIGSIQARMGSTRLPGKVLKEISGKPMLLQQIERIKKSRLLDDIVVATTTSSSDDEIVSLCYNHNIKYFRGSENDVLNRIASLIKKFKVDVHVEFFGDSPLPDPQIVDEFIGYYLKYKNVYDFVSNSLKTTYPPGQEVIVYNGKALIKADEFVLRNDPLREHVSIHITQNKHKYRICNLEAPSHYYHPDIYLEVDTCEDFELISRIFKHFNSIGKDYFSLAEILDYLDQNEALKKINQKVVRRWKRFRENV